MAITTKSQHLFASIDMGTNSFKLLIIQFDSSSAKFTTLFHQSESVNLGRISSSSLSSSDSSPPLISPDSQLRAIEALLKFKSSLLDYDVARTRVVGTSAIREAGNRDVFLKEVRERLGFDFDVSVLSGVEEARLVYYGVLQFLHVYDKKVLTLDIGGGSTEFVIGDHGDVVYADSLRLGHLTLTQKFGENDLVGIRVYVRDMIEKSGLVGKVNDLGFDVAIGSSGTIRAIEKAIWSGYGCDDGEKEGFRVLGEKRRNWWCFTREELRGLVERLCGVGVCEEEKTRRDGFFGKRSEFIVAGAVLLEEIMELLGISEMKVSGYALGEGVVAEMLAEAFPGVDMNTNMRWKSVMQFAMRFNGNDRMRKGVQSSAIAKDIFEGLTKHNKICDSQIGAVCLDEMDLEYLQAACMLHNIGAYFGKKGYHKLSYNIIMEHNQLDGYSSEEIELIAQLARHHRKNFPKFDSTFLHGFSKEKFGIICSILRISVVIQKHKILKLREAKFCKSHEGFVLVLEKKGDQHQPMLPNSECPYIKDIESTIVKEREIFEVVLHQKLLLVINHRDCVESSSTD